MRTQAEQPDAITKADSATLVLAQSRLPKLSSTLATWSKMAAGALTLGVIRGV